jgi:hypothetical protein
MFYRVFFFLLGFGLMIIGCMYIILYTNLTTIGYSFKEYINFISNRVECLLAVVGFIIITLSISIKGGKSNELHL